MMKSVRRFMRSTYDRTLRVESSVSGTLGGWRHVAVAREPEIRTRFRNRLRLATPPPASVRQFLARPRIRGRPRSESVRRYRVRRHHP